LTAHTGKGNTTENGAGVGEEMWERGGGNSRVVKKRERESSAGRGRGKQQYEIQYGNTNRAFLFNVPLLPPP